VIWDVPTGRNRYVKKPWKARVDCYKSSQGATLTDIAWKGHWGNPQHRLWRDSDRILGMSWDKVHDVACKLEHLDVPEVEERLAVLLGDTDTCPHGHAIPDKNGNI